MEQAAVNAAFDFQAKNVEAKSAIFMRFSTHFCLKNRINTAHTTFNLHTIKGHVYSGAPNCFARYFTCR
jgi:hypothetical protein